MNYETINPDLGQKPSESVQIQFNVARGNKYYLSTHLTLKGQGIKQTGDGSNNIKGKKSYLVTPKAMDKICAKYNCAMVNGFD